MLNLYVHAFGLEQEILRLVKLINTEDFASRFLFLG